MSNTILYDPLLVRHLAAELDRRLRGRACAAAPLFAADRSVLLPLDRGEALLLDLHSTRGWIRLVPRDTEAEELDALCLAAESAPDERAIVLRLRAGERFSLADRRLVVELHTNQWNALLVSGEDGRILTALRGRQAGERVLAPGQPYRPPRPRPRFGAGEVGEQEAWLRWSAVLAEAPEGERPGAIVREFAYTGSLSAATLAALAAQPGDGARRAFEHWWRMRGAADAEPVVLALGPRRHPYPFPLPGTPGEAAPSLLAAMARVAAELPSGVVEDEQVRQREFVRRQWEAAARRVQRLEAQFEQVGEADRVRRCGDLLLAKMRTVPRGASRVRLRDWNGRDVEIELDPSLSVPENAARYYREAKRRARAEDQLPEMIDAAEAELRRWEEARAAVERGELPAWVEREMARAEQAAVGTGSAAGTGTSLPFRSYRTSGGLEVRVGRSSRDNDRLTFGHSSPNDVWLHARSVPGSHVILRWPDPEGAPPARDLEEAAALAALFSKARTSALVPVDWARRRYVRKPRGAPPGAVIPQRVKTLFVEPDPELEERLRA